MDTTYKKENNSDVNPMMFDCKHIHVLLSSSTTFFTSFISLLSSQLLNIYLTLFKSYDIHIFPVSHVLSSKTNTSTLSEHTNMHL